MHRYGIITALPFSKYATAIFAKGIPNRKTRLLFDLGSLNTPRADVYIKNIVPVSTPTDADQRMTGQNLTVCQCIFVFSWLINNPPKCLHSTSLSKHLHRDGWYNELAIPYPLFEGSFVTTLTPSSDGPMCSLCQRYWYSRMQLSAIEKRLTRGLPKPSESWP